MDQNTNPIIGDSKVLPELPTQPITPVQTLPEIKPTPVVETKLEPAGFRPKLPDNKNLGQMGKWLAVIILGLSLLFFITTSIFYALDNGGRIDNVRITNVTANSATISWTTEDEVIGRVIWDEENNFMPFIFESIGKNVGYDDRDMVQVDLNQYELYLDGEKNGYTHHVTLRNLKPNTEYFFKVGSTKRYFSFGETSFKTFAVAEDILAPEPFYGKVSSAEFDVFPPTDGIVYYRVDIKGDGTQYSNYHSTTIDPESGYSADMGYLLDSSGKPVRSSKDSILQLTVETDRGSVMESFKVSEGVAPVPELLVSPAEASVDGELLKNVLASSSAKEKVINKASSNEGGKKVVKLKVEKENGTTTTKTKYSGESSNNKKTQEPRPAPESKKDIKQKEVSPAKKDQKNYSPTVKENTKTPERTESRVQADIITKNKSGQIIKNSRSTVTRERLPDGTSFDEGVATNVNTAVNPNPDLTVNRLEGTRCGGAASCASGQGSCGNCSGTGSSWCIGNRINCTQVISTFKAAGGDVALVEAILPVARTAAERTGGEQVVATLDNLITSNNILLQQNRDNILDGTGTSAWLGYTQQNDGDFVPTPPANSAIPTLVGGRASESNIAAASISCPTVTCAGVDDPVQGVSVNYNGKLLCKYSQCASVATFNENGDLLGCSSKGNSTCNIQEDPAVANTTTFGTRFDGLVNSVADMTGTIVPENVLTFLQNLHTAGSNQPPLPEGGTINLTSFGSYMGEVLTSIGSSVPEPVGATLQAIQTAIENTPNCTTQQLNECSRASRIGGNSCKASTGLYDCSTIPAQLPTCQTTGFNCSDANLSNANCQLSGGLYTCIAITPTPTTSSLPLCDDAHRQALFNIYSNSLDGNTNKTVDDIQCQLGSSAPSCQDSSGNIYSCGISELPSSPILAEVLGASTTSSSQILQPGVYEISGSNDVSLRIDGDSVVVDTFLDLNGDGIKQTEEPRIDMQSLNIKIEQTEKVVDYSVNLGWNLVGFEIVSSGWDKASELIAVINLQNINATHVATYQEGAWKLFSMRLDDDGIIQTFGDDYTIMPGQGYFIKTNTFGTFSLTGNAFAESVPINMSNGWNLLSVQSPTAYNAQDFLNKCVSGGVQCDSLARYDSGLYEIVVSQGGTFFGNNFNLIKKSGYFVRVVGGGGKQITP